MLVRNAISLVGIRARIDGLADMDMDFMRFYEFTALVLHIKTLKTLVRLPTIYSDLFSKFSP